jgi:putative nucleotidyltransferase with HDIG domain
MYQEKLQENPESFLADRFPMPPLPETVSKLQGALDRGDAGASKLASIITGDPVLADRLMGVVNSPYYRMPAPIRDVKQAVAFLGREEIRHLVLGLAIMQELAPDDTGEAERYLEHAFLTAFTAGFIANKLSRHVAVEKLRTAALLHDIGKLVYLKFFPAHYHILDDYRMTHARMLADAESYHGFTPHSKLGAALCERWRLPEVVRRACLSHGLPELQALIENKSADEELKLVCVANLLSKLCSEGLIDRLKHDIRKAAMEALGIDEHRFMLLMADIYDLRAEVQSFLRKL